MKKSLTVWEALKLLDESDSDDISDDESISEEDILTHISEEDEEIIIGMDPIDIEKDVSNGEEELNTDVFLGKDKTQWNKNCSSLDVRRREPDVVSHLPSVQPSAQDARTVLDAWRLYFPETVINTIVSCTNCFIKTQKEKFSRERDCKPTTKNELLALLGLLYISGMMRTSHIHLSDLWENDGTGMDVFPATMSLARFRFLLRCLRFDDLETSKERCQLDRIAPIREVFTEFVSACQKHLSLSEYVTIGEMLEKFRGKCPFRAYMKSKPGKCGIKIYALVDAKTFYVSSMEIYAGQQPDGPFAVSNAASDVVKRLISPISGTGRNVTVDNYFSSIPLAYELLEKHNLTMIGKLRKNKKEIPESFLPSKNQELYSSLFGFQDNLTLVSYVPKKNKCVLLISSKHHDNAVADTTEKIPDIINSYNVTKGGVDAVDKMKGSYSVARNSRRWPLTVFFAMMNIAGINSQIIFQGNTGEKIPRRKYLKKLGLELLKEHMIERKKNSCLPNDLKRKMDSFCGEPSKRPCTGKIGRCYICSSAKNRKTKQHCRECLKYICREHTQPVCTECSEKGREFDMD